MFRRAGWTRVVLILFVLLTAIVIPIVISGYADVRRADQFRGPGGMIHAGQYYESAAKKLPWKPGLWNSAAYAYAQGDDCQAAMPLFHLAQVRGVLSANSWSMFASCYQSYGQSQDALDTLARGLKQYPHDPRFYIWMASEYRLGNNFTAEEEALSTWVTSVEAAPVDHYRLGELLMASGPSRARAEFKQAASMNTRYVDAVRTLDASLALANLETSPSRRLVVIGRGIGLVNDWPLAQYDFQQAVDADPQNAEAWAWLGEAQQQNKQDGKAALDKALELDANSSLVHGLRGLYWKRQAKPKAALAEYQAAARLEPKNAEWQVALGDAHAATGDLVQALAAYVTATDLAPDNATYWRLLALFSADNGVQVLDVGLPAAKKAADIAPNDARVLDALGWTYSQAGLLSTAEQTLNKAIKIAPDSASAHLHLAETYLREGQASFAQSELNRVVQLDGDGSYGTFAAQLLKQYFP